MARRSGLFCAVAGFAVLTQGIAFALTHGALWAQFATGTVALAIASSVIYAFTLADIDGDSPADAWLRALERTWAAIVVDFVQWFVWSSGVFSVVQGDLADRLLGIPILLVAISLNFADVDAVISTDDRWWMLVPQALVRSMRTTWRGTTMFRAIVLVLTQNLAEAAGGSLLQALSRLHVPGAEFWADDALPTLAALALAALTAHVYLDAIGHEPKRSCSE